MTMSLSTYIKSQKKARFVLVTLIVCLMSSSVSRAQTSIVPLLREATAHMKNGEFNSALDLYLEGANLSPDDWRPYQGAGNAFFKLNDLDHALQYYREALALKGNDEKLIRRINEIEVAIQSRSAELPPQRSRSRQGDNEPHLVTTEPGTQTKPRSSSAPSLDWASRLEALENEARQKSAEKKGSFTAKFTPGRLLGSQFDKSGKSVAKALSAADWSIDWIGIDFFLPGFFSSNLEYSYSVVSNPIVLGGEIDFRRQVSPKFSFGFRFSYQKIEDPLVIEIKLEDPDPFFPLVVESKSAQDEAKMIALGLQLHYTKIGKKVDFYLGAIPSLYFTSISQSLALTVAGGGISFPLASQTSKVSGTGIGGLIQGGVKVKLGPAVSFFLDGGLELMRVGSMTGTMSTNILGFVIDSGSAVWARDSTSFFGVDLEESYFILPSDYVQSSNNVTESSFSLSMLKLGIGFGISF